MRIRYAKRKCKQKQKPKNVQQLIEKCIKLVRAKIDWSFATIANTSSICSIKWGSASHLQLSQVYRWWMRSFFSFFIALSFWFRRYCSCCWSCITLLSWCALEGQHNEMQSVKIKHLQYANCHCYPRRNKIKGNSTTTTAIARAVKV